MVLTAGRRAVTINHSKIIEQLIDIAPSSQRAFNVQIKHQDK